MPIDITNYCILRATFVGHEKPLPPGGMYATGNGRGNTVTAVAIGPDPELLHRQTWRFVHVGGPDDNTWRVLLEGVEDWGLHYDNPAPGNTITLGNPSLFIVDLHDEDIVLRPVTPGPIVGAIWCVGVVEDVEVKIVSIPVIEDMPPLPAWAPSPVNEA